MAQYYIYVQPGASKTELMGEVELDASRYGMPEGQMITALKIKLSSPPVEGAANKELIKFLAKHFKVTKSQIEIKRGEKSRYKLVTTSSFD